MRKEYWDGYHEELAHWAQFHGVLWTEVARREGVHPNTVLNKRRTLRKLLQEVKEEGLTGEAAAEYISFWWDIPIEMARVVIQTM